MEEATILGNVDQGEKSARSTKPPSTQALEPRLGGVALPARFPSVAGRQSTFTAARYIK
jgi:hypothetical protein